MTNNPFLTMFPQAATADAPETPAPGTPLEPLASGGMTLHELVNTDTDNIKALVSRADALLSRQDACVVKDAAEMRLLLDVISGKMQSDDRLGTFALAEIRNHVKAVMISLRVNPEYDTVLLDSDVHNLMAFAQKTYEDASSLNAVASVRKETKARLGSGKAEAAAKKNADIAAALGDILKGVKF